MNLIKSLAKAITDDLYDIGSDHNNPCHRIEFKGGTMDKETANGGFCKESFQEWLEETITKRIGG